MKLDSVLVGLGLKVVAYKLDGYKTYAGATGKILTGLCSLITGIVGIIQYTFPDQGAPPVDLNIQLGLIGTGFYAISSGLQGIGVAHKLEKAASSVEVKEGV